jgi:hypothetical protein
MHDDWMDIHAWNSRPIEDALRAELAAAQTRIAKLERLREAAQAIDAAFGTSDSLAACGELLDALHAVD